MEYFVGIDLGGTNIKAGVVTSDGKLLHKQSIKTQVGERSEEELVKDMGSLAARVIQEAGLQTADIKAIGIGSPGTPDNITGYLVYANNLRFHMTPMRKWVREVIDLPVYIENDANCAAMAESVVGAAKDVSHSLTITIGTGIGSGLIINNRIYSGFNQAGVEFGHTVLEMGGEPCTCGRRGCFEVYGSATALIRMTKEAAHKDPTSALHKLIAENHGRVNARQAFDAMRLGDKTATTLVETYLEYLSEGLANAINAYMPEILVIGGGVCNEGDALLVPLQEKTIAKVYSGEGVRSTRIALAQMGNDAGILGAAMMAWASREDGLAG